MRTLFGIFMIGILVINFLGYMVLDKRLEKLEARQIEIAGFLITPDKPEKSIRVFYDVGSDNKDVSE